MPIINSLLINKTKIMFNLYAVVITYNCSIGLFLTVRCKFDHSYMENCLFVQEIMDAPCMHALFMPCLFPSPTKRILFTPSYQIVSVNLMAKAAHGKQLPSLQIWTNCTTDNLLFIYCREHFPPPPTTRCVTGPLTAGLVG